MWSRTNLCFKADFRGLADGIGCSSLDVRILIKWGCRIPLPACHDPYSFLKWGGALSLLAACLCSGNMDSFLTLGAIDSSWLIPGAYCSSSQVPPFLCHNEPRSKERQILQPLVGWPSEEWAQAAKGWIKRREARPWWRRRYVSCWSSCLRSSSYPWPSSYANTQISFL